MSERFMTAAERAAATSLSAEDAKLLTLARGARGRAGAREGAAVRDGMGRTYAAASVSLDFLNLTAMQAAVAAALSSGSTGLDAGLIVSEVGELDPEDTALLDELGASDVILARPDGTLVARMTVTRGEGSARG